MMYSMRCASPLGDITLASDGENLLGLWLEGQKHFAAGMAGEMLAGAMWEERDVPLFRAVRKWLEQYFKGKRPSPFDLPLAPEGSEFRQAVWHMLREIPYGECVTYGEIAKTLASRLKKEKMSGRAVGGAVGHNPISIIIPCHRVVGADGSLTGYAGGIDKKIQLLTREGVDVTRFAPSRFFKFTDARTLSPEAVSLPRLS